MPTWAIAPEVGTLDQRGRTFSLVVIGDPGSRHLPAARAIAEAWTAQLAARPAGAVVHRELPAEAAVAVLTADLHRALVGHRILLTGTARDCLAVRAAVLAAGAEDDEVVIGVVDATERTVWCVHCAATTVTTAALEGETSCSGCSRRLVVHPHVSRRTGHHLGYMADAEEQPWSWPEPRA
ncbi:dimethylamine monooxygenase subunit DmmA family protein [Quadrisphaera granulorum]|uniref:dimethylamine monooxygenase subunit DmmA family protein n=1 Tax=Quadrisphaera granulorum TaxID=317664 RepID=UPI000D6ABA6E|nr:dimethylamine monooxygenase subunit DmmA family protein [Quadrisphaera granulorum]